MHKNQTLAYFVRIHGSVSAVLTPAQYLPNLQIYLADILPQLQGVLIKMMKENFEKLSAIIMYSLPQT